MFLIQGLNYELYASESKHPPRGLGRDASVYPQLECVKRGFLAVKPLTASAKGQDESHHLALLKFCNVLLEYEPTFKLDLGLLPDRMLGKDLVCCRKCRIMEHIRIAFQHISKSWT
jgi:hypothetical protein